MKTSSHNDDADSRREHIIDSDQIPSKHSDTSSLVSVERVQWTKQREFILSVAGGFIGLGNVWRFPYLCYKNGGGAFLIPYLIFLVCGGIPIFLLEIGMGQFMSRGGIEAWGLVPCFKGIGWASLVIVFWLNVYYIVILAWNLFYLFQSFSKVLPWSVCTNWWNSECCTVEMGMNNATGKQALIKPETCPDNATATYPEEEYWKLRVLQLSDGLGNPDGFQWELVATLAVSWIICYGCIWKGVKSTGKSVYVTSTFPLVMLLILLVRGLTLPGASKGIEFYIKPNLTALGEPRVWIDAGTQIFFSYAICLGSLTSLGSYNKFSFNSYKWCMILSGFNSGASIVSGFAIFSVLGFMAHSMGVEVGDVAEKGPGLAFIAYPRAINMMPLPQLWAVLFFVMLLLLGLASQYVAVEGMCTMIVDLNPHYWQKTKMRRPLLVAGACFFCFLAALPMVTKGGMYVFQLADTFGASGLCLLWVAFFECAIVAWVYGREKFYNDLYYMFGHKMDVRQWPWPIFGYMWQYVTPIICAATFGYFLGSNYIVNWTPTTYDKYEYPWWGECIGMFMAGSSIFCIPIYFIGAYYKADGNSWSEKWANMTRCVYPPHHPYNQKGFEKEQLMSSIGSSSTQLPTYSQTLTNGNNFAH